MKKNVKKVFDRKQIYPRADVEGKVFIHDDQHLFIAPLQNLSAGGAFVQELISIPSNTVVKLVIKSEHLENPVQCEGIVRRIQRDKFRGIAIEFTSLSMRHRDLILSCVDERRTETALNAD